MLRLLLILVIGFAAKSGLKALTESPRPYTELLSYELLIPNPAHFYKLSKSQQDFAIDELSKSVSDWRTKNWKGERDYSFPSGHTLFAAICLAFFGAIFLETATIWLVHNFRVLGVISRIFKAVARDALSH